MSKNIKLIFLCLIPQYFLCDNVKEFINIELETLYKNILIKIVHGRPLHSQSQGRINQILSMKIYVQFDNSSEKCKNPMVFIKKVSFNIIQLCILPQIHLHLNLITKEKTRIQHFCSYMIRIGHPCNVRITILIVNKLEYLFWCIRRGKVLENISKVLGMYIDNLWIKSKVS